MSLCHFPGAVGILLPDDDVLDRDLRRAALSRYRSHRPRRRASRLRHGERNISCALSVLSLNDAVYLGIQSSLCGESMLHTG